MTVTVVVTRTAAGLIVHVGYHPFRATGMRSAGGPSAPTKGISFEQFVREVGWRLPD
jgi:hypothetical protein